MKKVELYTDGACKGNPGAGGYAAVLVYGKQEKRISGGCAETTNNRMELMAAISGLEALNQPCEVTLYSDSKYLVDAIEKGWLKSWRKSGWIKSDKKPVLNIDLWERLQTQLDRHCIKFIWVRGHNGHEYNELCDSLAVSEAEKAKR